MKHYRKAVQEAARKRDGSPLYNGSLNHAAVLAEEMFGNANHSVSVFSGNLNARVYGTSELVEKARQFLSDTNHKVRILLEDSSSVDSVDHPFVREFARNNDVSFRNLPDSMLGTVDYHFIVMDGDSYRFEGDKLKPTAIAAFGDRPGGKRLTEIFETLWDVSDEQTFA